MNTPYFHILPSSNGASHIDNAKPPIITDPSQIPVDVRWELSYKHSFPWFKAGEQSEVLQLFGHAMNEGFHSMAYFALEYPLDCEHFIWHLENTVKPWLIESGWVPDG
jgi:hypothetical protein